MTSTETTSTGVDTSPMGDTDQHFRLVESHGKWSVSKDDVSGATHPVLVGMSERIARMVLAELQGLEVVEPPPVVDLWGLAEQVSLLQRELAMLREEMATEVRTRRLVVVDDAGAVRVQTFTGDSHTLLEVLSPPDAEGRSWGHVQLAAIEGEMCDDEGRSIASGHVTVLAGDTPGGALSADELDGNRTAKAIAPAVRGYLDVYGPTGLYGLTVNHNGTKFDSRSDASG